MGSENKTRVPTEGKPNFMSTSSVYPDPALHQNPQNKPPVNPDVQVIPKFHYTKIIFLAFKELVSSYIMSFAATDN